MSDERTARASELTVLAGTGAARDRLLDALADEGIGAEGDGESDVVLQLDPGSGEAALARLVPLLDDLRARLGVPELVLRLAGRETILRTEA
ncbi:MAG: hypothetical protein R3C15_20105 [Thermoleophilia bacterium]